MLWLYLLAAVTVLTIVLRRVRRRQAPLFDEVYSKKVAIEHVRSGVAWVRADGKLGYVNPAFAEILRGGPKDLVGQQWYNIFSKEEHLRVEEIYSQMLLLGKATFDADGVRANGAAALFSVVLVAVHDHKMRLEGHYCLVEDRTRELELEERVRELSSTRMRTLGPVRMSVRA
jgi:PAS domain S-box-containing protein